MGEAVGLPPEQLRVSQYIDDSIYLVQGFAHSMELAVRVVLEHIICGFQINVLKSDLLPSRIRQFLGCYCDSMDLSFSLTPSRCDKLQRRLLKLQQAVDDVKRQGGSRMDMRTIDKVAGGLNMEHPRMLPQRCCNTMPVHVCSVGVRVTARLAAKGA